jgi:hypothetical protein
MDDEDIDLGGGAIDDRDEPSTGADGDELRGDIEEAVAKQQIEKGDPEPYRGLKGRTDNGPGGMFEGCDEFAKEATKNGTTLKAALADYHGLEKAFRANAVTGFTEACKRLGYSPTKVAEAVLRQAQPQTQQQQYQAQYQAQQNYQAQAQHQAEYQRHLADIEASKRSVPFFENLRPVMTRLAQSGRVHTVKEAYDLALKINPTLAVSAEIARRDAVRDRQMGRGKRR